MSLRDTQVTSLLLCALVLCIAGYWTRLRVLCALADEFERRANALDMHTINGPRAVLPDDDGAEE